MIDYTVFDIAVVPVIIAVVALLTGAGLPKKFAPIVAVVIGVAAGVIYVAPGDIGQGVFVGLTMGLAASGLYSGTKNTIGK